MNISVVVSLHVHVWAYKTTQERVSSRAQNESRLREAQSDIAREAGERGLSGIPIGM